MFDRELRLKKAVEDDVAHDEEVPESEHALAGGEVAGQARGHRTMSREEAIQTILTAPVSPLPHMEVLRKRFGSQLDSVRAHVGPDVASALSALGAEAAAFGHDVAFSSLTPSVDVVAHELTHVLQQRQGAGKGEESEEAEAEAVERGDDRALGQMAPGGHGVAPQLRKKAVTHTQVDENDLVKAGEAHGALTAAAIASAIAWNDKKWTGSFRAQILAHLRGAEAPAEGAFTEADVEKVAKIQGGAGVADKECDGKVGDTTMAILLHSGLSMTFDDKVKVRPADVQLVFYPGEFEDIEAWKKVAADAAKGHEGDPTFNVYRAMEGKCPPGTGRLYVKWKGNLVEKIDCRGGPPITLKDGTHTADPSQAGTYNLGKGAPVRTSSWYFSQIGWGAKIRERADGEIEVMEVDGKAWKTVTGAGAQLTYAMNRNDFLDDKGELLKTWNKNDFGERGYRIENSPGMFIHTTPIDEQTVLSGGTPVLEHSHGCLHTNPAERQKLEREGFLQGGVTLTIKKYDVHLIPEAMRDKMQG